MTRIRTSWDSGPYYFYGRDNGSPWGEVAEVPDDVFERYERAEVEFRAAQDALDASIDVWKMNAQEKSR